MRFIKRLKTLFIRDKGIDDQEKIKKINKKNEIVKNSNTKSLDNINITKDGKNEKELLCYESFGKLKIYKSPIIKDNKEREQLHNQISKELEKLS